MRKLLQPLPRRTSIALSLCSLLCYAGAYLLVYQLTHVRVLEFAIIAFAVSGYLLGPIGGAIAGVAAIALSLALLNLSGLPGFLAAGRQWTGGIAGIVVSVTFGLLGRLVGRIRVQEGELRAAQAELEARVAARTAELRAANVQLSRELVERERIEAERKRLESRLLEVQRLESVGVLAGGIAHDFNNVLQMISGYTQLILSEKKADDEDVAPLKVIESATDHAIRLTRQLLLFSRQEQTALQSLDVNASIGEAMRLLEGTIPKMIGLEKRLAENLKTVDADPGQVLQVIMNLSLNARDAMPDGGRLVFETCNTSLDRVFAQEHPGVLEGDHVRLSVIDTGVGMDAETLTHIYDPFFTTKEIGRGTGLGLAVVYGIVANHHGHISCSSELGKGTRFDIFLPARGAPLQKPSAARTARGIPGGLEKILIVDDDENILKWESKVLEGNGYAIVRARSGEEAVRLYRETSPELVILDINMPGMGGYQCLQELLRIDPKVNVLIASGYYGDLLPRNLLKQGARSVILKPFTAENLLERVREVLDAELARSEKTGSPPNA